MMNNYKDKTYQENARNRRKAASPANEDSLTEQQTASSYKDEVAMTTVAPLAEQSQQMIGVGVDGHEVVIPNPGQDLAGGQGKEEDEVSRDLVNKQSSGDTDPVNPSSELVKKEVKKSPSPYPLRVLIDWDELSDKMAELHHKDIKNFWLCGQIDENGRLIDMVLEQQKADDMMVPELMEVEKVTG